MQPYETSIDSMSLATKDGLANYDTSGAALTGSVYTAAPLGTLIAASTTQAHRLIDAIRFFRLEDTMFAYVPARTGSHGAVDAAAHMLLSMKEYMKAPSPPLLDVVHRRHGKALRELSVSLDASEESYMACAFLLLFDTIMDKQQIADSVHAKALPQILMQLDPHQGTDFRRAAFYDNRHWFFHCPIAQNSLSPYDDGRWNDVLWASQINRPDVEACLLTASTQLLVRLPRLINHVHSIQQGATVDDGYTATLALNLCALENCAAEARLLEGLKIVETKGDPDWKFVPASYQYKSLQEWEAAVLYWIARLILIRLCQTLTIWLPSIEPCLRQATLRDTQTRMASNILKSWQYILSQGNFGGPGGRLMKEAAAVAWDALRDRELWNGMPVGALAEWIVWRLGGISPGLSVADMKAYLDWLSGGSTDGFRRMRRLKFETVPISTISTD
ncbi:hypothetical protein LTR10_004193 [Elasticomyces elasticus]|nr:hypothetical protein LTR10_004193 [Elasticomyces elasticus]KAK4977624.1 hypothetical protein LTR42_001995 [Elasticomyces elasticus]